MGEAAFLLLSIKRIDRYDLSVARFDKSNLRRIVRLMFVDNISSAGKV